MNSTQNSVFNNGVAQGSRVARQSANKFFGQMSRGVPQSPSGKGFYQDNSNR